MTELEETLALFARMGVDHEVRTDATLAEDYAKWRADMERKGRAVNPEDDIRHTVASIAEDYFAPEEVLASSPTTAVAVASGDLLLFFDRGGRHIGMGAHSVPDRFWTRLRGTR